MWQNFFKPWLLLLFVGLTTVFLVQILEFPFHKDFSRFKTLFLPLLLLSGSIYLLLGVPFLSLIFGLFQGLGRFVQFFRRHVFLLSFLPFLVLLYLFQYEAIYNAQLTVKPLYHIILPLTLLALFLLCLKKSFRPYVAVIAPALLILMSFGRVLHFSTPTWNAKLAKSESQPNVLLLIADTLRRDHTTMYGYERDTTPFLASLANESMVFDDVLSPSAWTKPAMASLLTSRYLEQDRILIGPLPVQWSGMRLPEFFHRAGYQTALLTSNPNTGSYFEATRGQKWIVQATPPRHFALESFVYPKLLHRFLRVKDFLKHRNAVLHMEQFQKHLGFHSAKELSQFKFGQLDSQNISQAEAQDHRKLAKGYMRAFSMSTIRIRKRFPNFRRKYMVPLMDNVYRGILKFSYITLEGAQGRIEDHWIDDAGLSENFFEWYENQYDDKRPFFVHMQYMGPHTPYREQPPYYLPYFDKTSGLDMEIPPNQHTLPGQGVKRLPADKHHNLIANYNDAIRITDANIKRVINFLKAKGELANTIIVFASDHGEAFHEHGIYGHMYSLHAEVVNVPMFVYYPKKIKPGRSDLPASLVDIFPTLISVANLDKYRVKAGNLEGMPLINSDGVLTDSAAFRDRIRYAITRTSFNPNRGKEKEPYGGQKKKKPHKKVEAIHRMVVKNNHKLVEEIDGSKRRAFLFALDNPHEERVETNINNPEVAALYQYFRPLPQEYLDANEPDVQNHPEDPEPRDDSHKKNNEGRHGQDPVALRQKLQN